MISLTMLLVFVQIYPNQLWIANAFENSIDLIMYVYHHSNSIINLNQQITTMTDHFVLSFILSNVMSDEN